MQYRHFLERNAMLGIPSAIPIGSYVEMEFRNKLRIAREKQRLSQDALGKLAGESQSRIARWEAGTGEPGPAQLLRLARALGVSLDYLADDALDEPPPATEQRSEADAMILALAKTWGYERAARRLQVIQPPPFAVDPPDTPPDAR
jgi:transcriptional regulator with XRE-family HTH domain